MKKCDASITHAGICVGGPDWPYGELENCDAEGRIAFFESLGYSQARCVYNCGGDYLRTAYMTSTFLGLGFHRAMFDLTEPVHAMSCEDLSARLARVDAALDDALLRLGSDQVDWSGMDELLRGVERCNSDYPGTPRAVSVLLCLIDFPPRPIVELPPPSEGGSSFDLLWDKYVQVHIALMRLVVRRYCAHDTSCVGAIEIINEPDYHWLPDEVRVEHALRPDENPLGKYLTELHLSQIPNSDGPAGPFYREKGGYYVEQPIKSGWLGRKRAKKTSVLDFDWGMKFDKYVACVADLHEQVGFAARDEAIKVGAELTLVSGAVTHNNLDYLIRMYKTNPDTFRYVDAIGLHPYHWPGHDMHDQEFVAKTSTRGWRSASPRMFAEKYFKRFDFLREVVKLVKSRGQKASYGMAGKSIWITEFGIPTKMLGRANAALTENQNLFIYPRSERIPSQITAIRWEDKWDQFLEQATHEFLRDNRVEALLVYTMRAGGMGESSDDEHSNFTLFDLDCRTPRMEESTFRNLTSRLGELCHRSPHLDFFDLPPEAVAPDLSKGQANG